MCLAATCPNDPSHDHPPIADVELLWKSWPHGRIPTVEKFPTR